MDAIAEEVISSVPVTLKTKAKRLLEKIRKSQGAIQFNEKGELLSAGKVMPGTHAVDLVNDVLRKRKGSNPKGWREFSRQLAHLNPPQDLVGNPDRWNWMSSSNLPFHEEPTSTTSDNKQLYASASHLPSQSSSSDAVSSSTSPTTSSSKKKRKSSSANTWIVYK